MADHSVQCAWCGLGYDVDSQKRSPFWATAALGADSPSKGNWAVLTECPRCRLFSVVYILCAEGPRSSSANELKNYLVIEWSPQARVRLNDKLPGAYAKDMWEAESCLRIGAPNAAATMCRRVISRLAIDNGADPSGTCGPQIDYLLEKGVIDRKLHSAAKMVKSFGDDAAHPPDEVSLDEAKAVFQVTDRVLYYALVLDQELASPKKP